MRRLAVLLLAGAAAAYEGKYEDDPRLARIRVALPARIAKARTRVEGFLQRKLPKIDVILRDAGPDRSGAWAATTRHVVVLKTEYLVLGAYDVEATLAHEFVHALQYAKLGSVGYDSLPRWVREGMALHVAGQGPARARLLAAHAGREATLKDPVAYLLDGFSRKPAFQGFRFTDYYAAAAVFGAAEGTRGREHVVELLHDVLDGRIARPDTSGARAWARAGLEPLVATGREAFLAALNAGGPPQVLEALDAIAEPGVYRPAIAYHRAEMLSYLGRPREALDALRKGVLATNRAAITFLDHALLLELHLLKALKSPEFAAAAARARKDLEPFPVYPDVQALLG